jgi:Na+/H+-dicarboxylate symporter
MRLPSLNSQILMGMIFGVAVGILFHHLGTQHAAVDTGLYASTLVGNLFIDLLKMVLIPLVFCSIAVGIANLRQHQQIHRVWLATLGFFTLTMAVAIGLGMFASN